MSLPANPPPAVQDLCNDLRTQIVGFIDALIEMFPKETDFIYARIFLNDRCQSTFVATKCLQYMHPHRKRIIDRDDAFFIQHAADIFRFDTPSGNGLTTALTSKIDHFKHIWQSPHLTSDDRDAMWNWFHVFVSILDQIVSLLGAA